MRCGPISRARAIAERQRAQLPLAVVLLLGLLVLAGCERRVAVPELRGRVLDARTGEPIAGAKVRTRSYRAAASNLEAARLIRDSDREAATGEDGRFELPGFVDKGISGVSWLVYAPGYMVGSGCYSEADWPVGGCSGFGLTDATDPWVWTNWERTAGAVDIEIRLFPPTTEGVTFYRWVPERQEAEPISEDRLGARYPKNLPDPWEEQLRRLDELCARGVITRSESLGASIAFLNSGGAWTDDIAFRLLRQVGLPIPGHASEEDRDPSVILIRQSLVSYCGETRVEGFCSEYANAIDRLRVHYTD